ncbi:hypothetical protein IFM89_007965 [Coptis chinensis]|uniref:FBD domain-containing protein n=1 Tax=Coptis chinensis TaxID=261450 RepID=A0A835MAC1_9MAGN|nr:hypothetical protein IFM89_007965 [Coptis chinensis]
MNKTQKLSLSHNVSLGMDRFTGLSWTEIHHILSFLPIQEVVRTCVLSKRWINIWSSVPSFHFNQKLFQTTKEFTTFVNSLLIFRDGSDFQKFHLSLVTEFQASDIARVDSWITYAVRHNVQALHIENDCTKNVLLTPQLFSCESLTELRLSGNKLFVPPCIYLPALKTLHLISVILKDGQLDEVLFSASPSLETFILKDCDFMPGILTISASKLRYLNLKGNFPSSIVISSPNLISLKLSISNLRPVNIMVNENLKSLSDANIDLRFHSSQSTTLLISIFKSARYLTLSTLSAQSISEELHKYLSILTCNKTLFSNLKWLKIETLFSDHEIVLINSIIRHSPEIESVFLVNDMGGHIDDDGDEDEDGEDEEEDDDEEDEDEDEDEEDVDVDVDVDEGHGDGDSDGDGEDVDVDIEGEYVDDGEGEDDDGGVGHFLLEEMWSECKLSHLKLIEIQGFCGFENEVKMVKIFLENAIFLERMIIMVSEPTEWSSADKQEIMKIGRKLLKHPRASLIIFLHDL